MNSMSRNDYNPCRKDWDYYEKDKKPCPVILKCGPIGSATIPAATVAGTAFPLASLSLNTSGMCNPCVKLDFSSNIVAAVAFTGTLSFQVFKSCHNQLTPVPIGPAYTFNLVALLTSETFSFSVCDCDSCFNECCTYSVVATVTSAVTVGTLSINNATLSALATCAPCRC